MEPSQTLQIFALISLYIMPAAKWVVTARNNLSALILQVIVKDNLFSTLAECSVDQDQPTVDQLQLRTQPQCQLQFHKPVQI